jgi:hypothetical protein
VRQRVGGIEALVAKVTVGSAMEAVATTARDEVEVPSKGAAELSLAA